jgi:hypothetical protein
VKSVEKEATEVVANTKLLKPSTLLGVDQHLMKLIGGWGSEYRGQDKRWLRGVPIQQWSAQDEQ